ncbi:DUF397 domain-containing protein [Actinomadura harenae]|uniref:DUF397 domain-containing protein n=1 Tax=Actinomadura harenae TaxID=2483351 RepID=A0A3M2MAY2_9ACTN|nr:DUF397 domain-containing protein [Actinomadura harenae]RMI46659.1 DUF397 domain-containing protein [Actinomadura harenae]
MTDGSWRKSSHSGEDGDHCVELAWAPEGVAVRDSKAPKAGHLLMSRSAFRLAVASINNRRVLVPGR